MPGLRAPSAARLGVGIALSLTLSACANRATTEILQRSDRTAMGTEKVAILPVLIEDDGPSWFYYVTLPFIWVARTISFDFTTDPLDPERGGAVLRDLCYLALDQAATDAEPLPLPLVDRVVAEHDGPVDSVELRARLRDELGANLVVQIHLERWGSSYYILETRNHVRARVELHSTTTGVDQRDLLAIVDSNDGAGITGGPTGFFDLALAPLAGVDTGPIIDLAAQVALGIGTLIGGLQESGELEDPPPIEQVQTFVEEVGPGLHRLVVRAMTADGGHMSFRIDGVTGDVTMRPRGLDPESGLTIFQGQIVSERIGASIGRRMRVRASTQSSRRASRWARIVEDGPARAFDEPRVPGDSSATPTAEEPPPPEAEETSEHDEG